MEVLNYLAAFVASLLCFCFWLVHFQPKPCTITIEANQRLRSTAIHDLMDAAENRIDLQEVAKRSGPSEKHEYIDRNSSNIATLASKLTRDDKKVLGYYYNRADSILEWGVGESTTIAAEVNVSRYTGTDAILEWVYMISGDAPPHFRFYFADIGPVDEWSYPIDKEHQLKFPFYSKGPLAQEAEGFDVYFVDGRFRVACALAALLHASAHGKQPHEFFVIIHDFSKRRHKYGKILSVTRRVDGCCVSMGTNQAESTSLIVLQRNPTVSDQQILDLYETYKYMVS